MGEIKVEESYKMAFNLYISVYPGCWLGVLLWLFIGRICKNVKFVQQDWRLSDRRENTFISVYLFRFLADSWKAYFLLHFLLVSCCNCWYLMFKGHADNKSRRMKCTSGVTCAKPWTVFCTQGYIQDCSVQGHGKTQKLLFSLGVFLVFLEQFLGDHLESLVFSKSFSFEENIRMAISKFVWQLLLQ